MSREKLLHSRGWEKKSTLDDPRLSEMVAAYEKIGLEVHIEPFWPEEEKDCIDCMAAFTRNYGTIYTRKKKDPSSIK